MKPKKQPIIEDGITFDSDESEFKIGDKINMTIHGLGSSIVEVTSKDSELHLWDITQGYYPLSEALKRKDMCLEKIIK